MKTIFLLRGVPGAGKTTMAKFMTDLIGHRKAACFSADDYMVDENGDHKYDPKRLPEVHGKCQDAVRKAMKRSRRAIFVHNTMTMNWELEDYFAMAAEHGYRVVSLIVENRHGNPSVHNLQPHDYDRFRDRFETKL